MRRKGGNLSYAGVSNNQEYLRDDEFFKKKIINLLKRENISNKNPYSKVILILLETYFCSLFLSL